MSRVSDSQNSVNLLLKAVRKQARSADPRDKANAHICLMLADAYEENNNDALAARWREVVRFMDAYTSHLFRHSPGRTGPRHFFSATPFAGEILIQRTSPVGGGKYQTRIQFRVEVATGVVRTTSTTQENAKTYESLAAVGDLLGLSEYQPVLSVGVETELGRVLEAVQ